MKHVFCSPAVRISEEPEAPETLETPAVAVGTVDAGGTVGGSVSFKTFEKSERVALDVKEVGLYTLFFENLGYLRRRVFKPYVRGFFMRMIVWYQRHLSKHTCLYKPTCSEYTLECINNHGVVAGILLGAWRILRCNPFSKGGYDPAPEKLSARWLY